MAKPAKPIFCVRPCNVSPSNWTTAIPMADWFLWGGTTELPQQLNQYRPHECGFVEPMGICRDWGMGLTKRRYRPKSTLSDDEPAKHIGLVTRRRKPAPGGVRFCRAQNPIWSSATASQTSARHQSVASVSRYTASRPANSRWPNRPATRPYSRRPAFSRYCRRRVWWWA